MVNVDYNAAQAHEYYLRNRKLKGRAPAIEKVPTGRSGSKLAVGSKPKLTIVPNAKPKMTTGQVKARVSALQKRLATLKAVLADLVKQLKDKGGDATKAAAKKTADATSTAKADVAAAKSSADYYDKNKAKIAAKAKKDAAANDAGDLKTQIKVIEDKIAKMRFDLAAAIKK
jgi:hypothetical protein